MKLEPLSVRIERYTLRIPLVECWLWIGFTKGGYAAIQVGGRSMRVHRLLWEIRYGPLPQGIEVRHMCDNPLCVREDHHRVGTHQDNMNDMKRKGRAKSGVAGKYGDANPQAKISNEKLLEMISRRQAGEKLSVLAQMYGVSESFVSIAARGLRRGHG